MGGINEIKYPMRYNHGLRFDFIQLPTNEIIKCGNDNMMKTKGATNK